MVASINRKTSNGRQKIEIKPMTNESARHVCFSKRRSGLFKKANELAILSGAQVAAIAFSGAGRQFSLGNPDVDSIINRFMEYQQQPSSSTSSSSTSNNNRVGDSCNRLMELNSLIDVEKARQTKIVLDHEIVANIFDGVNANEFGADDLKCYKEMAMAYRNKFAKIFN